jgi:hypothetical protein
MRRVSLLLSTLSLSIGTALAVDDSIVAKQLAGPPSEFPQMAAVDPAGAAIQSKHALVRVGPAQNAATEWQEALVLPALEAGSRVIVFSGDTAVETTFASGPRGAPTALATERSQVDAPFGAENFEIPAELHTIIGNSDGPVQLSIRGAAGTRGVYVLVEGSGSAELSTFQTHRRQTVGEVVEIAALLTGEAADSAVSMGNDAGRMTTAMMRVIAPDGSERSYTMGPQTTSRSVRIAGASYARFLADQAGSWLVSVEVRGVDGNGQDILRTTEHVVPVVIDTVDLRQGDITVDDTSERGAFRLSIPVDTTREVRHYRAYAEVWGKAPNGADAPVAWIGGMVTPEGRQMALRLDERWIALSGAEGPFELRNLRIEDPDHFVTLAEAKSVRLPIPARWDRKSADAIVIDERMRMGPRPSDLDQPKATGTRLVLVHGYCSGGVWPASQFSNASTFLDANQNRSNDQFARLISSFGAQWNSFGVVAHSQGGLASLHLYNYYWSGLDRATGNRLIQSVGSPYRGTNLAGILATLGNWFGVGCGTNDSLTYSGAQAWLAGISTASRAKVNYYTTSFRTTNWWTNDYCQFATDLVLSDPEDGTVEQVNGQLAGGVNRGHTTGQCHTDNMRDPAQYRDATRNSVMNTNAAR